MPEEELFKTEKPRTRAEIAETLVEAADEIEAGSVHLGSGENEQHVTVPDTPTLEVELERLVDPETGEVRYELEYEIHWSE